MTESRSLTLIKTLGVCDKLHPLGVNQCRVGSCCSIMCVINSFFGIPLQKAVHGIGIFKLVITIILAIISIVGRSLVPCIDKDGNEVDGGSIKCIGPYMQKVLFPRFLQFCAKAFYENKI